MLAIDQLYSATVSFIRKVFQKRQTEKNKLNQLMIVRSLFNKKTLCEKLISKKQPENPIELVHEEKKALIVNFVRKDLTSLYDISNVPQSLLAVGDTGKKYAFLTTRALKSL